jgi:phage baseplate assembly protein W
MTVYSFKSSGLTQQQSELEKIVKTTMPIGIKTPLEFGAETSGDIFKMHYNLADQVHDNLRNLLLTNWGERLCQYKLGANLRPLASEFVSQDDFDSQAISRIKDAVGKWMSYIDLENFLSEIDRTENTNTAVVNVTITYNVPSLQVKGRKLQIKLYVM